MLRILVLAAAGLGCNIGLPSAPAASPQVIVVTATGESSANPGGLAMTDTPTNTLALTMPESSITPTFTISPTPAPKLFGFLSCLAECRADGSNAVHAFPEKTTKVHARWNYENIPAGAGYTRVWTNQGQEWVRYECAWPGPETGADAITLTEPYGLRSGVWTMTITVGGKVLMKETLEIQGDWDYWDPAGTFNTCYGKAASGPGPGRIAFSSDRDGNPEIYTMDADGSHLTRLTNNPKTDSEPAWSPDGKHIAFISNRDIGDEVCPFCFDDIYVMDADGSHVIQLTDNPADDDSPSWSPDGNRIVFASVRDRMYGIYVMDADGSNVVQLIGDPIGCTNPAWSPDGKHIVFVRDVDEFNSDIFVMDADGSHVIRLTDYPDTDDSPSWSPDGQRIAYHSYRDGDFEIYMMDADGSNVTRITDNEGYDTSPAWSPDGKRIAFSSERDGNYEIYVMDADGSNVIRLTNNPTADRDPDWR